jgi:tetratricopeptide (TPR) repeat protein
MEHPKPVSFAFIQAALNEMGAGDTLKSLEYIEKGRKLFPDDKNLITLELMVYQNQGKENELTDKLTKALEADPGEPNLLFNRATLFDNRARKMNDDIKILLEKGLELKEKLKKTFKPDEQKKIKSEIITNDAKVNAIKEEQNKLDDLAIADYKKALESNPDFYDAIFNMGAIHFNRAVPLIEEANALPLDKDYDKKYQVLKDRWMKLYEVALEYFLKAEDIKPNDDSLLLNIQSTYAQLGNQTKSMEYKAKRDGL